MVFGDRPAYGSAMETEAQISERWRYLRSLLIDQLERFETGALQIHTGDENVSVAAIRRLKREIEDFDGLIAASIKRTARTELGD